MRSPVPYDAGTAAAAAGVGARNATPATPTSTASASAVTTHRRSHWAPARLMSLPLHAARRHSRRHRRDAVRVSAPRVVSARRELPEFDLDGFEDAGQGIVALSTGEQPDRNAV